MRQIFGALSFDRCRRLICPAKIPLMKYKEHDRYDKIKTEHEDFIEKIVDELLTGNPEQALKRLESSGYDLEDLRV